MTDATPNKTRKFLSDDLRERNGLLALAAAVALQARREGKPDVELEKALRNTLLELTDTPQRRGRVRVVQRW